MKREQLKNSSIILLSLASVCMFPLTGTADWWYVTLDSDNYYDGDYNSLTLDSNNNPYISYRSLTQSLGDTRYAYHDGIAWHQSIVDTDSSTHISLHLNGDNKPSTVYRKQSLRYAWCDSVCDTTWDREDVPGTTTGYYPSSRLDSSGMPHVSYWNLSEGVLEYTYRDETGWVSSEIIDSEDHMGYFSSLDLDSGDNAHISYCGLTSNILKYATNVSGDWETQPVDPDGVVQHFSSIALDSEGNAHISYYEWSSSVLKYATNVSGDWITKEVETVGPSIMCPDNICTSIALDSEDKAHISYYDFIRGEVKYATNVPGDWMVETIDGTIDGWRGGYFTCP